MYRTFEIVWLLIFITACSGTVDLNRKKSTIEEGPFFDPCLGIKEWTPTQIPDGSNFNSVIAVPRPGGNDLVFGGYAGSQNFLFKVRGEGGGDPTFGKEGLAMLPPLANLTPIGSLNLDWKGRILVLPTNAKGKLLRVYTDTGKLDYSFGQSGIIENLYPNGESNALYSKVLSLSKSKKYLVSGYAGQYPGLYPMIVRLNENGSVDTSFGNNGFYRPSIPFQNAQVSTVTLDSEQRLVFSGYGTDMNGIFKGFIARALEDGSQFDPIFNSGNPIYLEENQHVWDVKVLENNVILIGGAYSNPNGTLLGKLTSSGVWLSSFGQNGKINLDSSFTKPTMMNIHLDNEGNLFLASLYGGMIGTRKLRSNGDENADYLGESIPTSAFFGWTTSFFSNNGIASILLTQKKKSRFIIGAPKLYKATIWCVDPEKPMSQFE